MGLVTDDGFQRPLDRKMHRDTPQVTAVLLWVKMADELRLKPRTQFGAPKAWNQAWGIAQFGRAAEQAACENP